MLFLIEVFDPILALIPITEVSTDFACIMQPSATMLFVSLVPDIFEGASILARVKTRC